MFSIQPRRRRQRNKELTPIRVRPAIRHTQDSGAGVFEGGRDFVFEVGAVDGAAAAAGAGRIASLDHEGGDYTVDGGVVVVAAVGEGGKVLACLELFVNRLRMRCWWVKGVPLGRGRCRAQRRWSPKDT